MDWTTFWDSISVLQLVGWIVGIIAVLVFAYKAWPVLRGFVKLVENLQSLPTFMNDTTATLKAQDAQIGDIHHEVKYNNGSSVKDAIRRVESGVKGIYARLDSADQDREDLRHDLEDTRPLPRKRAPRTTKKETP